MNCREFVESFVEVWEEHLAKDDREVIPCTRDQVVSCVKLAKASLEGGSLSFASWLESVTHDDRIEGLLPEYIPELRQAFEAGAVRTTPENGPCNG